MGIPCPLFSVLNQKTAAAEYNPWTQSLGLVES